MKLRSGIGAAALVLAVILVFQNFRRFFLASPEPAHKSPSGAMQAFDFFAAARAYPQATIPDEGHYRAFEYSRASLRKTSPAASPSSQWQLLGPLNVGGRTNAIAFNPQNPNTIYAGAASGGLWRSFSAGIGAQAWEYVETGFPVLGVGAIAIDPAHRVKFV